MTLLSRRHLIACSCAALMAAGLTLPHSLPAEAASAESFISSVGNKVLAAARARSGSQFRSLLRQNADIPSIAMFALGNYRSKMPRSRQSEYFGLFEKYISDVFVNNATKLGGNALDIKGSKNTGNSVIVTSQVQFSGRQPMPVIWRLRSRGGGYKIIDVSIEGVWLAIQQRTNFVSLLNQNNGNIDALFSFLKK
ncbi:ABC transporter substrate-binding protein [Kaustia mangrovi]|uniref:ABC transporter substrate-binding protein n=1 Tax=Kaustia mangrovi TaxID=2593653 RepID=A0A7S8HAG2_9HYPH|nr:ABC transporter substrate-binding protein [Kaustia mangrovi]QPC41399.1 ABC transporter substrate-binding protein [Kaustia mangrovi]